MIIISFIHNYLKPSFTSNTIRKCKGTWKFSEYWS